MEEIKSDDFELSRNESWEVPSGVGVADCDDTVGVGVALRPGGSSPSVVSAGANAVAIVKNDDNELCDASEVDGNDGDVELDSSKVLIV